MALAIHLLEVKTVVLRSKGIFIVRLLLGTAQVTKYTVEGVETAVGGSLTFYRM